MSNKMSQFKQEAWFGDYNRAPNGWREITEEEVAKTFFRNYIVGMDTRQLVRDNQGNKLPEMLRAFLIYNHDSTGLGLYPDQTQGRIRYFTFQKCEHKWEHSRNLGRCYNEYKCELCGDITAIDSGD